jgi:hypothetical protein
MGSMILRCSVWILAVGEIAGPTPPVPTNFTGHVLILTGREDQIVCGNGNITALLPDCGVGPGSNTDRTRILSQKLHNLTLMFRISQLTSSILSTPHQYPLV